MVRQMTCGSNLDAVGMRRYAGVADTGFAVCRYDMKRKPPRSPRKRADTKDRAEQALERTSDKPPQRTDDPARDKATIDEDGVIEPLKHAD